MKTFFTSDTHFSHKNIIKYSNRPFSSIEKMNYSLIKNWNNVVNYDDTIYHLGDFGFGNSKDIESILNQLNGNIHFILGNHDKPVRRSSYLKEKFKNSETLNSDKYFFNIQEVNIPDIKRNIKQKIVLCHFPIESWNKRHYDSWHLHGHCVDLDTEILTFDGWKKRSQISTNDLFATIDLETSITSYSHPIEIIDKKFSGIVVDIKSRNVDACLTDKHTCIFLDENESYYKDTALNFIDKKFRIIPLSGKNILDDYNIVDDRIRLLAWISTSGNILNNNKVFFNLKNKNNTTHLTKILKNLKIKYSREARKAGISKINFKILSDFSLKPITRKILNFSKRQIDILVKEYLIINQLQISNKSFRIITFKKEEADLLQQVLVLNNYSCSLSVRRKGNTYSSIEYVLLVSTRVAWTTSDSSRNYSTRKVTNKDFWCIVVPNQTFFIRRNGKVHITGNCHGTLESSRYQSRMDVGVDSVGQFSSINNIIKPYTPIEYQQIKTIMNKKEFRQIDHHRQKK